jgi:hypothetical protein
MRTQTERGHFDENALSVEVDTLQAFRSSEKGEGVRVMFWKGEGIARDSAGF